MIKPGPLAVSFAVVAWTQMALLVVLPWFIKGDFGSDLMRILHSLTLLGFSTTSVLMNTIGTFLSIGLWAALLGYFGAVLYNVTSEGASWLGFEIQKKIK